MKTKNLVTFAMVVTIVITQAQMSSAQTANKSLDGWTLLDKNAQAQASLAPRSDKSLDGWTLLGSRSVDYTLNRDVVSLKQTKGYFVALKFIVKNGAINIHNRIVHFVDGDMKDIAFSDEVKTNDCLLLESSNQAIDHVTFSYDTNNCGEHSSIVELWGKM